MHSLELSTSTWATFTVADGWIATTAELERIAAQLLGPLPGGWVRRGDNFIRINGECGADAHKLDAEISALAVETKRIIAAGGAASALRAATFYHLRFEKIHPLCEANGRIGRVILAAQLQQSVGTRMADTLTGLKDWEDDYKRLFSTHNPPIMFEMLLDLLSRITGIAVSSEDSRIPANIEPLHPQKKIPKNVPRLRPEDVMKTPDVVKKFAKQSRPLQQNPFFHKFR